MFTQCNCQCIAIVNVNILHNLSTVLCIRWWLQTSFLSTIIKCLYGKFVFSRYIFCTLHGQNWRTRGKKVLLCDESVSNVYWSWFVGNVLRALMSVWWSVLTDDANQSWQSGDWPWQIDDMDVSSPVRSSCDCEVGPTDAVYCACVVGPGDSV